MRHATAPSYALRLQSAPQHEHTIQGARLVAAPADGHTAILQMPRGNLEAISPRLLTLASVVGALRAGDYAAAWRLAVGQRIDLNLLVDDRWPAFLEEAPAFVQVSCCVKLHRGHLLSQPAVKACSNSLRCACPKP